MTNNLTSFMRNNICTLTVVWQRMGGAYCAFLSAEDHAEAMASDAGGKYDDHDNLSYGLFHTDWFPVGFGETPQEAIDALEERITNLTNDPDDSEGIVYNRLFNTLVCRTYRETGTGYFTLQPGFFPDAIPDWLKSFSKIDEDLISSYAKHVPIKQDSGWTPLE
ncbi:hypothetical protein AH06_94 [Erwinia phage AH06]|nr:hypothetical protein AH06_94 [Erwinia phage AH06]